MASVASTCSVPSGLAFLPFPTQKMQKKTTHSHNISISSLEVILIRPTMYRKGTPITSFIETTKTPSNCLCYLLLSHTNQGHQGDNLSIHTFIHVWSVDKGPEWRSDKNKTRGALDRVAQAVQLWIFDVERCRSSDKIFYSKAQEIATRRISHLYIIYTYIPSACHLKKYQQDITI